MKKASLDYERSSDGALNYIRVAGVINEHFDGRRAASRTNSKRVIVNCSAIELITSFGLRQWSEFVHELEKRKADLYYVECSARFTDELNQVPHFARTGRVLSTYAPYVCPQCRATRSVLLRTDLDAHVIRSRQPPAFSCLACGSQLEFDDDPASYFPGLEPHVDGHVEPSVLSFLEARLNYETERESRLTVRKVLSGNTTVLSLAGTLDETLKGRKLAQGLEGEVVLDLSEIIHVQQAGLRSWRELLMEAFNRSSHVWLVGCPALVIERALDGAEGLSTLGVVSVRLPYHCEKCDATEFVLLDLGSREGGLVQQGHLPRRECSGCKAPTKPMVGARIVEQLQQLPQGNAPGSVTRAVKHAHKELQAARKAAGAARSERSRLSAWVAAAAATLVVGAALAVTGATLVLRSDNESEAASKGGGGTETETAPAEDFERPDWIVSDSPASSYCVDLDWQISCVGVSSYRSSKEAAEEEAFHAATEVFVHTALLNVDAESLAEQREHYLEARSGALQRLEQANYKAEDASERDEAVETVRKARARVFEIVQAQGASGAPTKRADSYWEEYEGTQGGSTEFLAFARVDVSRAEQKAFAKYYSEPTRAAGARLVPMSPGMGWLLSPEGESPYFVHSSGGRLRGQGVKTGDVLVVRSDVAPGDLASFLKDAVSGEAEGTIRRAPAYEEVEPLGGGD